MLLVKYHKSGINDSSWRSGGIILLNNKSTFGLLYNYSPMLLSMPFYSQCKVTVVGDYLRQQQCMVQIRKDNMIRAQHHMKQYQDQKRSGQSFEERQWGCTRDFNLTNKHQ